MGNDDDINLLVPQVLWSKEISKSGVVDDMVTRTKSPELAIVFYVACMLVGKENVTVT
jgi:myo-inositol-1-phosphate synthase